MLGVGPGGLISDFELFKLTDHGARNRMVVEAVDMIQRIWAQDPPYALKGEFWDISIKDGINARLGVGFMPKPYQQPAGPPVFISLASPSSASAKTAAEKDWGMISANIIPAYSVAIRDLYPSSEASWRMPLTLFTAMSGMAAGSWFAGYLYDHFGYYAPAFATGIAFNVVNLAIIGYLVVRLTGRRVNPYAAVG